MFPAKIMISPQITLINTDYFSFEGEVTKGLFRIP
jgi:hypothetical protein